MKQLIKGYDNYWIYDTGEVYNSNTKQFLKGSIGEHGYRYYRLSKNNKKKMFYGHRLVAEAFLDNPNNLPVVNHIDGNKLNNNINNLEWVSYSDNTQAWHKNSNILRKQTEYFTSNLENEIWKSYNNYLISNYGRVQHSVKHNLLRPSLTCGYYKVRLSNNGLAEDHMVHQLVWQLFSNCSIQSRDFVIDHIDGNKLNNHIDNLRQISISENVNAALYETKTNSSAKPVGQYDLQGEFIKSFPSAAAAARELKLDSSTITKVCRGKNKTHGGFIFKYI